MSEELIAKSIMVDGKFLKDLSSADLQKWIQAHRLELAGGACFTKNNSWLSKTVQSLTQKFAQSDFVPSHVGSLILLNGSVYLFDMKPPKSTIRRLVDYIESTTDDFRVMLRGSDFVLDVTLFSEDIFHREGELYGYFSALQCAIKKVSWIPNRKEHCSEIHAKALKAQGYFRNVKCDDETPVEVYDKLMSGRI